MEFVIATRNKDKLKEIRAIFSGSNHTFRALDEFPGAYDVEETGATFAENALLKARSAHKFTRLPALADDSGLVVDALGGEPGINSARYAGDNGSYADNNNLLLRKLVDVPPGKRQARFVCTVAIVSEGAEVTLEDAVNGEILPAPRGSNGFGYDPLFLPEGETRSFAEMTKEEKELISHRGRAFRKARYSLDRIFL